MRWCYVTEEWCSENLLREGIPPDRATVMSVEDFDHLPFRSGSMDIVALPFVTCTCRAAVWPLLLLRLPPARVWCSHTALAACSHACDELRQHDATEHRE